MAIFPQGLVPGDPGAYSPSLNSDCACTLGRMSSCRRVDALVSPYGHGGGDAWSNTERKLRARADRGRVRFFASRERKSDFVWPFKRKAKNQIEANSNSVGGLLHNSWSAGYPRTQHHAARRK